MHRSKTSLVGRLPGRVQPRASALHRRGVAATYRLHDRVLSNPRARSLYARNRPSLDDVQRRIVSELDAAGCAVVSFHDLFSAEEWESVDGLAARFIAETEAGLAREAAGDEAANLRRRAGKEFLVRKYDLGGTLDLDDPWLGLCLSPRMLAVAGAYLRLWVKLEYVDLWYSIPQPPGAERRASQLWHRDFDDRHLLKAFLYLSDVDEAAGPFEYLPGSQPGGPYSDVEPWKPMWRTRVPDERIRERVGADAVRTFTGPRGALIFCNTSGLHRGGFATGRRRVLATVTYCSPASLASLTERNFSLAPGTDLGSLGPPARYALT